MLRVIFATFLAILALLVMSTVAAPVALGSDDAPLILPAPADPVTPGSRNDQPQTDPSEWVPLPFATTQRRDASIQLPDRDASVPRQPRPQPALSVSSPSSSQRIVDGEPTVAEESHWILSIRHCSQDCPRCACQFEFEVWQADWNGCWESSSMAAFQQSLIPGVPVCIMIHGSFVTEETVAEDSCRTFRWLRQAAPDLPLQVVFISWPSDGIFTLDPAVATSSLVPNIDVGILGRRAELNGCRIAKLVQSLPPQSPVCLLGHSHGSRMVSSALHFLGGGELHGIRVCDGPGRRVRGVLAAAAIDHDWLIPGERYGRALCGAECVLNLQSKHDWALSIYPLRRPFSRRALGQTGFTSGDRRRLKHHAARAVNLDCSQELGIGHIWPRYYERPELAAAIVPWVYFTDRYE